MTQRENRWSWGGVDRNSDFSSSEKRKHCPKDFISNINKDEENQKEFGIVALLCGLLPSQWANLCQIIILYLWSVTYTYSLRGSQVFSTLDFKSGFWQLAIHPEDGHKYDVCHGHRHFYVQRDALWFDDCTCFLPTHHEQLVWWFEIWFCTLSYIDDLIIYSFFFHNISNIVMSFYRAWTNSICMLGSRSVHLPTTMSCTSDMLLITTAFVLSLVMCRRSSIGSLPHMCTKWNISPIWLVTIVISFPTLLTLQSLWPHLPAKMSSGDGLARNRMRLKAPHCTNLWACVSISRLRSYLCYVNRCFWFCYRWCLTTSWRQCQTPSNSVSFSNSLSLMNGIIPFLKVNVWQSSMRLSISNITSPTFMLSCEQMIVISKLWKDSPLWWPLRDWCTASYSCSQLTVRFSLVLARIIPRPNSHSLSSVRYRRVWTPHKECSTICTAELRPDFRGEYEYFAAFRTYYIGSVEIDESEVGTQFSILNYDFVEKVKQGQFQYPDIIPIILFVRDSIISSDPTVRHVQQWCDYLTLINGLGSTHTMMVIAIVLSYREASWQMISSFTIMYMHSMDIISVF